ncbi:hypothetical protein ABPG73_018950 [Tetrahymena malaccensis]
MKSFSLITILWLIIQRVCSQSVQCPKIASYNNIIQNKKYSIYSPFLALNIPKTNTLIINALNMYGYGESIVYFLDLSTDQQIVTRFIKPDYSIQSIDYIEYSNQIIVVNIQEILIVDSLTFLTKKKLQISNLMFVSVIKKTKYAVITTKFNKLYLIDTDQNNVLSSKNYYINDINQLDQYFYYSKTYQFKCQNDTVILTASNIGIFASSINMDTLAITNNGLVNFTQSNYSSYSRVFYKHPYEDIIFVCGDNLQVQAIKVESFKNSKYILMMDTYLNSSQINYPIDIFFFYIQNMPKLLIQTWVNLYQLDIKIDLQNNKIYPLNDMNPEITNLSSSQFLYHIEGTSKLVSFNSTYISIYDYQTRQIIYRLFHNSDLMSKSFIYEGQNIRLITSIINKTLVYRKLESIQDYYVYYSKFTYNIYQEVNSFYKVKNCTLCLLAKLRDQNDYVSTASIYPSYSKDYPQSLNTNAFSLSWNQVGNNLDPFYFNYKIWIVLSFPDKSQIQLTQQGLFYLINSYNTNEFYILLSPDSADNQLNTAFALASLYDINNPEIIGVDQNGQVYIWDFLSLRLKNKLYIKKCQNSNIGQLYQDQKTKKLLIVCEGNILQSYDLNTQDIQIIKELSSNPQSISVFPHIQMIAIPDYDGGTAYLYKYNSITNKFDSFLQLSNGSIVDNLIYIELLSDNTLWLQFQFSYLFFPLQSCLDDVLACKNCTNSYYFNVNNTQDYSGSFGLGTAVSPFTTSENIYQTILSAQNYIDIVQGVTNIKIQIFINPDHVMKIDQQIFNYDSQSKISLEISSSSQTQVANIQYKNMLVLKNYYSILLKDIQIQFQLDSSQQCGIYLQDIKIIATINNIQLLSPLNSNLNCQQIVIENSYVQLLNYDLTNQDFTSSKFLVSTTNTMQISIQNLTIFNSTFGDQFQILLQNNDLQLIMQNLDLELNKCSINSNQKNNLPLFTAGHYTISQVKIQDNTFCNKNIFQTIISYTHLNQTFTFEKIQISNNIFFTEITYLFFSSLYSILSTPNHNLSILKADFYNNQIRSSQNVKEISFFQTDKIQNIYLKEVNLINHNQILLGTFDNSFQINILNFNCSDEGPFNLKQQQQQQLISTKGCLLINDAQNLNVNQIYFENKIAVDNSLLMINNQRQNICQINITNGIFNHLLLNQTQKNTIVNPIQIQSNYEINLNIQNSVFNYNQLKNIDYSQSYSTTGLWIQSQAGNVNVHNCSFANSQSNSKYNYMFIQTNTLAINQSNLTQSSFNNLSQNGISQVSNLNQIGSMVFATIKNMIIQSCQFNQSIATKGSFLYVQSFGADINLLINNTLFNEGYSLIDGSAIFIESLGNQFNLNCYECFFQNLFTFTPLSSAIGIQFYKYGQNQNLSNIQFVGGSMQNIQGIQQTYFLNVQNAIIKLVNVSQIASAEINSNSIPFNLYKSQSFQEQSTLLSLADSQLSIINTHISNLKALNEQLDINLLILSQNSTVYFKNSSVIDCKFQFNLIQMVGGQLILDSTVFQNLNQINSNRNLIENQNNQPTINGHSVIASNNTQIKVINKSQFQFIDCKTCNGGAFQIKQGQINIQNSIFNSIHSNFGGAIFIDELYGGNLIQKSFIQKCSSQIDGGAIFISSQNGNNYGEFWSKKYAKSGSLQCTECDKMSYNIWILIFLIIFTFISMQISVQGNFISQRQQIAVQLLQSAFFKKSSLKRKTVNLEQSQKILGNQALSSPKLNTMSKITDSSYVQQSIQKSNSLDDQQQSVYIKLFTNYFQIISSVVQLNLIVPTTYIIIIAANSIFILILMKRILYIYVKKLQKKLQKMCQILSDKLNNKNKKEFNEKQAIQKTINPQLKIKAQNAFKRYLNMNEIERRQFFNTLEQQQAIKNKEMLWKKGSINLIEEEEIQTSPNTKFEVLKSQQNRLSECDIESQDNQNFILNTVRSRSYQSLQHKI